MKTEFNVERVCERVHLCIVDAPEELGAAKIEVRGGSIYVSFPADLVSIEDAHSAAIIGAAEGVVEASQPSKPKRKGR